MTGRDIAIVGAGMAGASLAAALAPHASVLLLEAEDQPGYHSTGRSAAFWSETYGGPSIRPLTSISGPFLVERGFLQPRGAIHLADAGAIGALEAMAQACSGEVPLVRLDRTALEARVPGLRPEWREGLLEPGCADIDVAALHAFYLGSARGAGAAPVTGARLVAASNERGKWRLETTKGDFNASLVVDAAGAWADEVARICGVAPLGIQPYRRTIAQLRVAPPVAASLPLVIDAAGRFYFKPEAGGRLWLSPHDETPTPPCDSAPEEIDVARAIARLETVVDWRVERVERKWAGLRSFAPDRLPVYGFARNTSGSGTRGDFFWFAGQGGFGIQTAPAAAELAAGLVLGRPSLAPGIDPAPYLASRFRSERGF